MSLYGQFAWVVGGAGIVGRGICRGLLRAGCTVLVNSRHPSRLTELSESLDHPANLVMLQGSMLPGGAEQTVQQAMDMTGGQIDHVVAHSGVMWWDGKGGDESATLLSGRVLGLDAEDFAASAVQLPLLHFEAARRLLPRLGDASSSRPHSYTFVTGGSSPEMTGLAQVNAHAMRGLSAALQKEAPTTTLTVAEMRVLLQIGRAAEERAADPRTTPLTHDLGTIAAGIAGSPAGSAAGLHTIATDADVIALQHQFPAMDAPYPLQ